MDTFTHAVVGGCVASAVAHQTMPEYTLVAAAVGFIAALLPDIDYLFVYAKKPIMAWKYHRVAFHNVFVLPLLAFIAIAIVFAIAPIVSFVVPLIAPSATTDVQLAAFDNHFMALYGIAVLALTSHLVLDYITSFGSEFFYPLSKRRFALGSHFLTDPLILVMAAVGWWFDAAALAVFIIIGYLALAVALKYMAQQKAIAHWRSHQLNGTQPKIFPRPGAPWRWLAVAEQPTEYAFFYLSPLRCSKIQRLDKGLDTQAHALYKKDPLLKHFVGLSAFPRFEDTQRQNQNAIVVEDVQWWWALPTRPMAFSALVDQGQVTALRESKKLDKGPTGEAAPPPFLNDTSDV